MKKNIIFSLILTIMVGAFPANIYAMGMKDPWYRNSRQYRLLLVTYLLRNIEPIRGSINTVGGTKPKAAGRRVLSG